MIVGENARSEDMDVNPTKEKKLTNMRAAASDETIRLFRPAAVARAGLEFIERRVRRVTPSTVRLRKVVLDQSTGPAPGDTRTRNRRVRNSPETSRNTLLAY